MGNWRVWIFWPCPALRQSHRIWCLFVRGRERESERKRGRESAHTAGLNTSSHLISNQCSAYSRSAQIHVHGCTQSLPFCPWARCLHLLLYFLVLAVRWLWVCLHTTSDRLLLGCAVVLLCPCRELSEDPGRDVNITQQHWGLSAQCYITALRSASAHHRPNTQETVQSSLNSDSLYWAVGSLFLFCLTWGMISSSQLQRKWKMWSNLSQGN